MLFAGNFEGTRSLVCKLLLWLREVKVGHVELDLISYLVVNSRAFLLVVLVFHLVSGFFEGSFGSSMDFLHL